MIETTLAIILFVLLVSGVIYVINETSKTYKDKVAFNKWLLSNLEQLKGKLP